MSLIMLHAARRTDATELVQANLDSRDYHGVWMQPFTTLEGFQGWLDAQATDANAGFIARDVASGRIVGVTNLSQIFLKGFQSAYLSYYGVAALARRGLMTEAVKMTVAYAFNEIGLHRLEANIQPTNQRSIALVRRIGFRKEGFSPRYLKIDGVWCDHERWALLADEPPT